MKLQLKNHLLSRINGAIRHDNIEWSYEVCDKEKLFCHVNSKSFYVTKETTLDQIKQSALTCLGN